VNNDRDRPTENRCVYIAIGAVVEFFHSSRCRESSRTAHRTHRSTAVQQYPAYRVSRFGQIIVTRHSPARCTRTYIIISITVVIVIIITTSADDVRSRRPAARPWKRVKDQRPRRAPTAATTRRHVRQPTVLPAMEQPPKDADFGVRQSLRKRYARGLHAGRRGTVPKSSQSRVVCLQSVLGGKCCTFNNWQ